MLNFLSFYAKVTFWVQSLDFAHKNSTYFFFLSNLLFYFSHQILTKIPLNISVSYNNTTLFFLFCSLSSNESCLILSGIRLNVIHKLIKKYRSFCFLNDVTSKMNIKCFYWVNQWYQHVSNWVNFVQWESLEKWWSVVIK
jgi:hypothetical protein